MTTTTIPLLRLECHHRSARRGNRAMARSKSKNGPADQTGTLTPAPAANAADGTTSVIRIDPTTTRIANPHPFWKGCPMKSSIPSAKAFQVRILPIEKLIPAPYNPRRTLKPTDKAYRKLEASIREFGLVEPLIWNERTGHVVGGHARLAILKAIGLTEVPVSIVRLSDVREKALNV